jgi:pyridoxamine 5'-phosphate oxidase
MDDPLDLFREWLLAARAASPLRQPNAVCVSTMDAEGAPDARFVDLKEITQAGFVFCTQLESPKALALAIEPRIALTFWWDHIGRQVRVSGTAARLSEVESDRLFSERPRDAQIASWASSQSSLLDDPALLDRRLVGLHERFSGAEVPRPNNWGGYLVVPVRIEFLTFRTNRMHERLLFSREGAAWRQDWLQP